MDPELIAYLDERFRETSQQIQGLREETSQQIQGLREETSQRFDKMAEQLRLTDVKVEDLRGQIQVVAEGVAAGNESLKAFRETVALEFDSSRANVNMLFKDLNRRVRDLELRSSQPPL